MGSFPSACVFKVFSFGFLCDPRIQVLHIMKDLAFLYHLSLSEYNNFLTLLPCSQDNSHQIFKVHLANSQSSSSSSSLPSSLSSSSTSRSFSLLLPSGRCLRPHERRAAPLESPGLRGIFGLDGCPQPGEGSACKFCIQIPENGF